MRIKDLRTLFYRNAFLLLMAGTMPALHGGCADNPHDHGPDSVFKDQAGAALELTKTLVQVLENGRISVGDCQQYESALCASRNKLDALRDPAFRNSRQDLFVSRLSRIESEFIVWRIAQ